MWKHCLAGILLFICACIRLPGTFGQSFPFEIVADKKRCIGDGVSKGKLGLRKCASLCARVSVYFAHGTNDYGQNKCTGDAVCDCICENSEKCIKVMNTGYRLYRKKVIGEFN